ncbi:MAG: DUF2147 domain-containing protein [Pseudomonadota bacterium]
MSAVFKAMVITFGMAGAAFAADPVEGVWQTQVDDGAYAHVTISPCGSNFCGVISRTFKDGGEYASPNLGKQLVRNMSANGGGSYEGKVWRPSNNKIYIGKIDLNGDSLRLRGCIAGGLLCSKQTWARVK